MLTNVVDFFKNLPAKKCSKCGEKIEEQHECYGNHCENCLNTYKG
ncbi:protein YhfH [Bacillus spongiae]|uniref:Protein YhfH n=1 Tax=Bacillus spongiae TaxID=2683610 RepID=A0ABU8HB58_9BACI